MDKIDTAVGIGKFLEYANFLHRDHTEKNNFCDMHQK